MNTGLYCSFSGYERIAYGGLEHVLRETKAFLDSGSAQVLIFDVENGRQVDFDFRGSADEAVARALGAEDGETGGKAGPGRPKLGVRSAEVTLLPRHWEWLNAQPGKASGTLRNLVEASRAADSGGTKRRIEALGTFLWSIAGNLPGFEEATRALYAGDIEGFESAIASWPDGLRDHALEMAADIRRAEARPEPLRYPAILRAAGRPRESAGTEPWRLGAARLAAGIAAGEWKAAEVVASFIARIEEVNPRLNALVEVWKDEAMRSAEATDARRARGLPLGPLAGVPFTVKSNIDVAGKATTHGTPALAKAIAGSDAPAVERLRAAGAIPLAHSNMPDLSLRFHTMSSLYGATVNPRDGALSPGGSSGGEGVAVGAGMSPLGLGNDAGGSVRLPALFSGCASLKPGSGRVPSDKSVGPRDSAFASQVVPVDGLLAREVRDLHLAYQIVAGPDPRDPRVPPVPLFGRPRTGTLRVALARSHVGEELHPDVARALDEAAAALEAGGYRVEEADLPRFDEALEAYSMIVMAEFARSKPMLERLLGPEGRRYIELSMEGSKPVDLAGYQDLIALRQGIQRDWAAFLERRPLVLGPVFAEPSVQAGADIESAESHARIMRGMGLCSVTSFLGLPAASLPAGTTALGLPLGVQLVASPFREDLCLEAALALEARLGPVPLPEPGAS